MVPVNVLVVLTNDAVWRDLLDQDVMGLCPPPGGHQALHGGSVVPPGLGQGRPE